MVSGLHSMYNAQRALMVNQAALDIVNNNIANMNTEGYSKQRVELSQIVYPQNGVHISEVAAQTGGGACIDDISRNRDIYLDKYFRSENSENSYYKELGNLAMLVEDISNEMDGSGINDALDGFFKAAQKLNGKPSDPVIRSEFVQEAVKLAGQFNNISEQLTNLRTSLVGDPSNIDTLKTSKIHLSCEELNNKLESVANLNYEIAVSSSQGTTPNGLLDQRDKLLDEISEMIPIEVIEKPNNLISINMNGVTLIDGNKLNCKFQAVKNPSANPAEVDANPAVVQLVDKDGNLKVDNANDIITTGKIKAILDMGGSDANSLNIKNILTEVDKLAVEFAQEVNDVQLYRDNAALPTESALCMDSSTNPPTLKMATEPIFVNETGTMTNITAANIKINQNIVDDPYEVATAKGAVTAGVPDEPNATGNSSSILEIAQLRNKNMTGLNSTTPENFITSLTGDIGVKGQSIKDNIETQKSIVDQIKMRRQSAIGVNLDEELVDLVKFQRAYEAAARMFSVSNQILQQIVNLGR